MNSADTIGEGGRVPYDQASVDALKWEDGFPRQVIDLLQKWIDSWVPPSTEEIEQALDAAWIPKLTTPKLSYRELHKVWEKLGIEALKIGEAIVATMEEWESIPLSEAIDRVTKNIQNKE